MGIFPFEDIQNLREDIEITYNHWLLYDGNDMPEDISPDAIFYNDDGTIADVYLDVYLKVPSYSVTYIIEFGWHVDSGKSVGLYYENGPFDWFEVDILEEPHCTEYTLDSLLELVITWIAADLDSFVGFLEFNLRN